MEIKCRVSSPQYPVGSPRYRVGSPQCQGPAHPLTTPSASLCLFWPWCWGRWKKQEGTEKMNFRSLILCLWQAVRGRTQSINSQSKCMWPVPRGPSSELQKPCKVTSHVTVSSLKGTPFWIPASLIGYLHFRNPSFGILECFLRSS